MAQESFLSTRLETPCPRCQTLYRLAEPTDALAARPVTVNVYCPQCGKAAALTLTERGQRVSSFAPRYSGQSSQLSSSSQSSSSLQSSQPPTNPATLAAGLTGAARPNATSGVGLASRYSLRAEDLEPERTREQDDDDREPDSRSCA